MKRIVAIIFLLLSICVFVYAEMDDSARFLVNDRPLTDMSIAELYDFEDAIVSATVVAFNNDVEYTDSGEAIGVYVVNAKTKKFHYPWCYAALQIVAVDRQLLRGAPSEFVENEYSPCGLCKPHVNK